MFARWGRFVYRWRWATLVVSVVLLAGFIYTLMAGGTLTTGNSTSSTLEAGRAATPILEAQRFGAESSGRLVGDKRQLRLRVGRDDTDRERLTCAANITPTAASRPGSRLRCRELDT